MSTRGQMPLPGATERLLRATKEDTPPVSRRVADYHSISIQRRTDGTWRAMRLRLDAGTHRIVPELLDTWTQPTGLEMSPAEALLYWAQQAVLDERGVLR